MASLLAPDHFYPNDDAEALRKACKDRDAILAHVAIKKSECNYNVIIEIAAILSPEDLLSARKAYQVRYKNSLEEDLAAHTTGDIRKVLRALITAKDFFDK